MHKKYVILASLLGGLAVVLGAFGAHGLKKMAGPVNAEWISSFKTGVQYHMYHALAILAVAALYDRLSDGWANRAVLFFLAGIILFSGSLYTLTLLKINEMPSGWAGPITPLGGVCFIVGWVCLAFSVARHKN